MIRKAALVPMAWIGYKVKDSYEYRQRKAMAVDMIQKPTEAQKESHQRKAMPTTTTTTTTTTQKKKQTTTKDQKTHEDYVTIVNNEKTTRDISKKNKHNLILPDILTTTTNTSIMSANGSPSVHHHHHHHHSPTTTTTTDGILQGPLSPRSHSTPASPIATTSSSTRQRPMIATSRSSSLVSSSKDDASQQSPSSFDVAASQAFQRLVDLQDSNREDEQEEEEEEEEKEEHTTKNKTKDYPPPPHQGLHSKNTSQSMHQPANLNRSLFSLSSSSNLASSAATVVEPKYVHAQSTTLMDDFAELQQSKQQMAKSRVQTASLFTDTPPTPKSPLPASEDIVQHQDPHHDPDSAFSFHHPGGDERF